MPSTGRAALVLGASRGLGLVLVRELARRNWQVVATARSDAGELPVLAGGSDGRIEVERLELTSDESLAGLHARLAERRFDLVLVNAAIERGNHPITEDSVETFTEVMITNALAPLRAVEALRDLVVPGGTVAVMSSRQGSVSSNTAPGYELYKASKAALNQLMRSYATRRAADGHTLLLLNPGHNRTALGGDDAPLTPDESIPSLVDVLEAQTGRPGLRFLDRFGETVPW